MNEIISETQSHARSQDFLYRLKLQTAPQHEALESQSLLRSLMTPEVNRKQYYDYLIRMKKILEAYEDKILPLLNSIKKAQLHSSVLIEDDLLHLSTNKETYHSLPDFTFPENLNPAFAWGFAYVIEGSKLGGRVIFKHMQKTIGISEEMGGGYLANKGEDTGMQWKLFLQQLSSYTLEKNCEHEVMNGAIFGFTSIHDYFEKNNSDK